jgi:hypothetical protein
MSAVVDFVKDVFDGAADIISDVVESVGDVLEDVVDVIKDAGSWIDDNVLQPLKEDPIGTIATVAAVATGNAHLVPYINAANTVAKGGDLGDAALSFGASYVGGKAGQVVGQQVSQTLSTVAVDAAGNVIYQPAINIASSTAAGAARGATTAAITGQDIGQGALTGAATGAAGGAGREAGQFVFDETGSKVAADITAGVTRGATQAALTDRDIGIGAIMGGTNVALNTAVNFGSEYLFGEKKDQEDWQKAVTQVVGTQFTQAGMQEVYENVADMPTRPQPQPTQVAMQAEPTIAPTGFKYDRGDFELRRFVNDAGDTLIIAFRDGKPQQTIPPGYKEEKAGAVRTPTATQLASAQQQTGTQTTTPTGVSALPSIGIQAPASTVQRSGSNVTMQAAKGGLAAKKEKKEKKPTSSKGLAAKKK